MSAARRAAAGVSAAVALVAAVALAVALPPGAPRARAAATAPPFTGDWKGAIRLVSSELEIRVAVRFAADTLAGTIDIPAQGARGLALEWVRQRGDSVHFELPSPGARGAFDGVLRADSVSGVLKQLGMAIPFSLRRAGAEPPPVEPPVPYRREEVTVTSGAVTLAGTLTIPEGRGPFPAVALLSGSGPQNRDEEILGYRPFRDLADHLTRRGIAVLRTDDRGVGGSTGDFAAASLPDFAADARAAVAFLRARREVDRARVGLLGHSEGGIVAPLVAAESKDVAFVVLLAAPTVPGDTLMFVQGELIGRIAGQPEWLRAQNLRTQRMLFRLALTGEGRDETERLVREVTRLAAGAPSDSAALTPELRELIEQNVRAQLAMADGPWLRTFLVHDPGPVLAKLRRPLLAVYGENDLQVPPGLNVPVLEAAAKLPGRDFTIRVLPRTNHLFQETESGSPALYAMLPKAFAPGVLDSIGSWIEARTRRR